MTWLQLRLDTHPDAVPALEQCVLASGALSVTLEDNADQPVLEPGVGETPLWSHTRLTGLYPADTDMEAVLATLPADVLPQTNHRIEILEDKDWEREWEQHYQPMQFGSRLWVCPSWQQPPDADAVNLLLDPGLAFGTGTHPTTALCLSQLDGTVLDGATVVDYGCGSGILAVASMLLGARRTLAVDNDPQALVASRDNAARNGLDARQLQTALPGPCDPGWLHDADIVVANILAGPLMKLAPTLLQFIRPGGTLLLSGLLHSQAATLCDHYAPHIALRIAAERDGWVCLRGNMPATDASGAA